MVVHDLEDLFIYFINPLPIRSPVLFQFRALHRDPEVDKNLLFEGVYIRRQRKSIRFFHLVFKITKTHKIWS